MYDLTCRSARRMMQAPRELQPWDLRHLDAHIEACKACREARAEYGQVDRHIQTWLQQAAPNASVRNQVRSRLEEANRTNTAAAGSRSTPIIRAPRRLGLAVLLSVAVVLLAIAFPQAGPGKGRGPATASASWRLVRAEIGYPLTVDPRRSSHLLAGAYGQVYESWNEGASWHQLARLPRGLVVRDLAIDAGNTRHYLVAVKHSVYATFDGGAHWRQVVTGLGGAENMFLQQDPLHHSTFYLGPSILWKSSDSGRTWLRAGVGTIFAPNGIQALAFAPNGDLYTAILGGGVAVSHNGGRTWARRAAGLPARTLSVSVGVNGTLWAAGYGGVYMSTTGGRRWTPASLPPGWLATSVAVGRHYVLAAGDHAVYRSHDGGRHWVLSMKGLPLDPYVYGLIADPSHPGRVYASLNSDGVFRSDDGGRSWSAIDNGLPVQVESTPSSHVLFLRRGALWITDRFGTDPGQLTVEHDVRLATLTPDGAGVAYVAGSTSGWSVRVLGAGGSAAHTVETRRGALPWWILWSPNSSLLAVVESSSITVMDPAGATYRHGLTPGEAVVGWAADGQSLLFWNSQTAKVIARKWNTWVPVPHGRGLFPGFPVPAPDGRHVAAIQSGTLFAGTWSDGIHPTASVRADCGISAWSGDSTRLLLRCGPRAMVYTANGSAIAGRVLAQPTSWAPGSPPALLFFRHGMLWSWTFGGRVRPLVREALPVRS